MASHSLTYDVYSPKYDVYLIYDAVDREAGEWFTARFREAGLRVLDDVVRGVFPRTRMEESRACVLLIGARGLSDRGVLEPSSGATDDPVVRILRDTLIPVVSILLPGAPDDVVAELPSRIPAGRWLDLRHGLEDGPLIQGFLSDLRSLAGRLADEKIKARSQVPPTAIPEESIHLASASDQPTAQDSLGFEPYVDAIAKFLASEDTKPPLTLSIEGEWGSGKSSFMLMLEESLRAKSKPSCLTLRFNAWRHDKEDALWAAFALEFIRRIRRQRPVLARWLGDFRLFFSRYHWWEGWGELVRVAAIWTAFVLLAGTLFVAFVERGPALIAEVLDDKAGGLIGFLGRLGGGAGALAVIAVAFLKIKDLLGSPLQMGLRKYLRSPDYQDRVAFVERFHEDFDRIVKAYAGDRKIYVFIDDLDRCEIPKAADLMQALNLLIADDPRLIFIVGMDREKVAAGLAVKYEKLLPYLMARDTPASPGGTGPWPPPKPQGPQPSLEAATRRFGLEYGYSFLEKFIQLPFRVPHPEDITRFLTAISPEAPRTAIKGTAAESQVSKAPSIPATQQPDGAGGELTPEDGRLTSSRSEVPPEVEAARIERMRVNFGADSEAVRTVVRMVAPALESNPRRLKQFVNLFRLKAFIANLTGLFDEVKGRAPLTFEQLAKFVAIGLAWPALFVDLDDSPDLLAALEQRELAGLETAPSPEEARWMYRPRLRALLRHGCVEADGKASTQRSLYTLTTVDWNKLLRISPRVVRPTPSPISVRPAPATASASARGPTVRIQAPEPGAEDGAAAQQPATAPLSLRAFGAASRSAGGAAMLGVQVPPEAAEDPAAQPSSSPSSPRPLRASGAKRRASPEKN